MRALSAALATTLGAAVLASGCAGASNRADAGAGGDRATGPASPSCVPSTLNVSAALAGARVTVSPGPGTRDASAAGQVSFLYAPGANGGGTADGGGGAPGEANGAAGGGGAAGADGPRLSKVLVTGSRSGVRRGRLLAYSQGDGASFVPDRPFTPGEHVTVHAVLEEAGRSTPFAWSFTVAVPDRPGSASVTESTRLSSTPAPAAKEYQSFRSRPELRPPDVTVSAKARTATGGDLFLSPYSGVGQYGPMILDEHGNLVWFKSLSPAGTRAANFRVQQYEGRPVLTWWQDPLSAGGSKKAGEVIADSSYRTIAVIRAGNGYQPDLHEFTITPQGTGLITVYDAIDCNLSSAGGAADGAVADTLVQEIDLKTGLVMYEWHSLDHVPLTSSYASVKPASKEEPFDYFHINSVDVVSGGDMLVDSRNTWAAYDVDPRSGQVRWTLGGKRSSFKLGAGTSTAWQHDAREQPDGAITFFDNGASPDAHPQSRAIELALDTKSMTATLVRRYEHENPLVADSQGNLQALANGDWMVGWGQAGYLSEVDPAGRVLFNAHLPPGWESYRTFALPWSGQPSEPPAVSVAPSSGTAGRSTVYVSWNGATNVVSWRVLAGSSSKTLATVVPSAPKTGFETAIPLPAGVGGGAGAGAGAGAGGSSVVVQALDAQGAVIGVSGAAKA